MWMDGARGVVPWSFGRRLAWECSCNKPAVVLASVWLTSFGSWIGLPVGSMPSYPSFEKWEGGDENRRNYKIINKEIIGWDTIYTSNKHHWCSGNINAFQAFALGSIPGWCTGISILYPESTISYELMILYQNFIFSCAKYAYFCFISKNPIERRNFSFWLLVDTSSTVALQDLSIMQ
jgi:hypothetical protein